MHKIIWESKSVKQGILRLYDPVFVNDRLDPRSRRNLELFSHDGKLMWTVQDPPSEWEGVYFAGIKIWGEDVVAITVNGEVFKLNMDTGEVYFMKVTK